MSFKDFLIRLARAVLNEQLNVINLQKNIVQQQVLDMLMNEVASLSDIWVGDDADSFLNEMQSRTFPHMEQLVGATTNCYNGIVNAAERIDQADTQIQGIIEDLNSEFASIFTG